MKFTTKVFALILVLLVACCSVTFSSGTAIAGPRLPMLKMLSTNDCPACDQMAKVLEQIKVKYKGKLATERVNLEQHQDIARKYNVRYVPTLIFLDSNNNEIAKKIGYMTLDEVLATFRGAGVKI